VAQPVVPEAPPAPEGSSSRLTESILDNLSFWTVVAVLIGVLYLVWATLEILSKYVGGVPSLGA
jgi:hypothetical protein